LKINQAYLIVVDEANIAKFNKKINEKEAPSFDDSN
jgi:hypothetical protein